MPLGRAVASSCAVPGIFPPVTIKGRRYMDGGIGSTTNATLAAGFELVLVVALTGGASAPVSAIGDIVRRRFQDEMNTLRSSGSAVEVVRPNEEFVTSIGINLMDFTRRREAAEIGLRQGRQASDRLRSFWG